MLIVEHRLLGARQRTSPHADARPDGATVDLVVVHAISLPPGQFGSGVVEALFLGVLDADIAQRFPDLASSRVSAHLFIERDGRLTQFVPFDQRAWHAGVSRWRGRDNCNDFSVGIELEGTDELSFTDVQYLVLEDVVRSLRKTYGTLADEPLVGHADIAPGRKTDPGPHFDWSRLRSALARR